MKRKYRVIYKNGKYFPEVRKYFAWKPINDICFVESWFGDRVDITPSSDKNGYEQIDAAHDCINCAIGLVNPLKLKIETTDADGKTKIKYIKYFRVADMFVCLEPNTIKKIETNFKTRSIYPTIYNSNFDDFKKDVANMVEKSKITYFTSTGQLIK